MTKYPKAVWVGFSDDKKFAMKVSYRKAWATEYGSWTPVLYHLHPGNEVKKVRGELARALNVLHQAGLEMIARPYFLTALQDAGFRVRRDAKRGSFV